MAEPAHLEPRRPLRSAAIIAVGLAWLLAGAVAAQAPTPPASGDPRTPAALAASPVPSASAIAALGSPEGTWRVSGYDPSGTGLVEPLAGSRLTVVFLSAGRLESETPCGTFTGGYSVEGEGIRLGIVSRGPGDCGRRREEESVQLTRALSLASRWAAGSGSLDLLDEQGRVRVALRAFDAGSPLGPWRIVRHAAGRGGLRDTPKPAPGLVFEDAGSVSGSTGCRPFKGSYSTEGDRLLIAPIDLLGLACDGRPRRIEQQLLAALDGVVSWQRDGGRLTLFDGAGDPLVVAEAIDAASSASPAVPSASLPPAEPHTTADPAQPMSDPA